MSLRNLIQTSSTSAPVEPSIPELLLPDDKTQSLKLSALAQILKPTLRRWTQNGAKRMLLFYQKDWYVIDLLRFSVYLSEYFRLRIWGANGQPVPAPNTQETVQKIGMVWDVLLNSDLLDMGEPTVAPPLMSVTGQILKPYVDRNEQPLPMPGLNSPNPELEGPGYVELAPPIQSVPLGSVFPGVQHK